MKKIILLLFFVFIRSINGQEALPKGFGVPFHTGMTNSQWYRPTWTQQNAIWKQIKEAYDSFINNLEYDSEPRIPKIIHQIWIGSPLPQKYERLQQSWKEKHPDWEYILWTEKDIEEFGLTNKYWYDKTPNFAQKADIVRYEVLYRLGGVYIDMDFECLQSLDPFHHTCDFYTGIAQWWRFRLFNGLIGSMPGHPILKECIESMNLDVKHHSDPRLNVTYTTGPEHLTRCFIQKISDNGKCIAFPSNYFYPWPWYRKHENKPQQIMRWIKPESFAVHHWAESWFNQPLLRKLLLIN
ncbi:MAG: glycosyltransferase [Candidatus Babeliales bacterium]